MLLPRTQELLGSRVRDQLECQRYGFWSFLYLTRPAWCQAKSIRCENNCVLYSVLCQNLKALAAVSECRGLYHLLYFKMQQGLDVCASLEEGLEKVHVYNGYHGSKGRTRSHPGWGFRAECMQGSLFSISACLFICDMRVGKEGPLYEV